MPKTKKTKKTAGATPTTPKITAQIKNQQNSEVELDITIPQQLIDQVYQDTLAKLAKQTEIKGFRKGSAPTKLVEEKLGKDFILRKASESILTIAYLQAIQQTKITPITDPKLTKAVTPPQGSWQLTFIIPVLPEIDLPKDYLYQIAKKVKNQTKIITPDDAKKDNTKKDPQLEANKKLSDIFSTLLEISKVKISATLIESETNRRMASIFDQLQKMNMTVQDYTKSKGITPEQLRDQISRQITEELSLDFLLAEISKRENITVPDQEVEKILSTHAHDKDHPPSQQEKTYVKSLLQKQKVVTFLLEQVDKQNVIVTP
ncbi:MAG: hypothetical protein GXP43_01885 [bacterium]|nr:hypothetical protein [bacterium]